jgi:hypothetical protein
MGDESPLVEFLDPGDGPGDADEVLWLGEEGLGSHRPGLLPPRATARRITGSVLVFALALSLTGFSGLSALRHARAVAAAANELILREVDVGDAVTLTDPNRLGGANAWRIEPSASIAIGVTNESPDTITLLPGSQLTGPGLAEPSTLAPSGTRVLAPGQSGRLTGTVTVDCGVQVESFARPCAAAGSTVLVQARTASGAVGVAALTVGEADGVRQQICDEQGNSLAASFFPVSVNALTRTFTVAVAARSLAAQPLKYWVSASFGSGAGGVSGSVPSTVRIKIADDGRPVVPSLSVDAVDALLPGVRLEKAVPMGPVDGTLAPGASLTAGFTVHVQACPASTPSGGAVLDLQMFLDDHGQPAFFQSDGFNLADLVAAACGLIA